MKNKLYKSIETLPIFNYNKIKSEGDLRFLNKSIDYDFIDDIEITDEHAKVWDDIQKQYEIATSHRVNNNELLEIIREIAELRMTYEIIQQLTFLVAIGDEASMYKLSEYGYHINHKNDAEKIKKKAKNLITKANILELKLVETTDTKSVNASFEDLIVNLEEFLKREINVFTTTVKKFIAIEDMCLRSVEKRKKVINGSDKE